jgi:hypothetical protein
MEIKDTDHALEVFKESALVHGKSTECGDYKMGNKAYGNIVLSASFLKEHSNLNQLERVLLSENIDISVKGWIGTYLLGTNEVLALSILNEIIKSNTPIYSFNARQTINEWKQGTLKLVF